MMIKKLFLFLIFSFLYVPAQDIEELQEGFIAAENSSNLLIVDIKNPFDYYFIPNCAEPGQFRRAQFPGGDNAYKKELLKNIATYIDNESYVVNGVFFVRLDISEDGEVTDIDITPKVENSELFRKDLKFAIKKIKTNWTPSKCVSTAIHSTLRIRINFLTETAEQ